MIVTSTLQDHVNIFLFNSTKRYKKSTRRVLRSPFHLDLLGSERDVSGQRLTPSFITLSRKRYPVNVGNMFT